MTGEAYADVPGEGDADDNVVDRAVERISSILGKLKQSHRAYEKHERELADQLQSDAEHIEDL